MILQPLLTLSTSGLKALMGNYLIQLIVYVLGAIWAFMLSFNAYTKESGVPVGLKLVMASVAGLWSWIYIGYYLFIVYIMGSEP